jgi:adenylate cyclase
MKTRSIRSLAKAGDTIAKLTGYLDQCTEQVSYVFIDLCGSTLLKEKKPQSEWLPIVCKFLLQVTETVKRNRGKVVKYIGDEVFAVFPNDTAQLSAARVEHFIWECEAALSKLGLEYVAKYSCDYGAAAVIDERGDVLGTCIDRCARIAKLTKPHVALASADFVNASKGRGNWRNVGSFKLRGLLRPVKIFQLKELGAELVIADPELFSAPTEHLVERIKQLTKEHEATTRELRTLRSKVR